MSSIVVHRNLTAGGLLSEAHALAIANVLCTGGLAVLPTETGYLLGALATDREAVLRVFAVKERPHEHAMHVACSSVKMARDFCADDGLGLHLLAGLTPGPFSVVVAKNDRLPDDLVTLDGTVGLRIPDAPVTLQVVAAVGAPITATSLNRTGEEHLGVREDELRALPWPPDVPAHVVDTGAEVRFDRPSTLARVSGTHIEILRDGPVGRDVVHELARSAPNGLAPR